MTALDDDPEHGEPSVMSRWGGIEGLLVNLGEESGTGVQAGDAIRELAHYGLSHHLCDLRSSACAKTYCVCGHHPLRKDATVCLGSLLRECLSTRETLSQMK